MDLDGHFNSSNSWLVGKCFTCELSYRWSLTLLALVISRRPSPIVALN